LPDELKIPQYQSYLGSPLVAGDQTHGWLSCYRQKEKDFSLGEISLLVALARQMGLIVENQRLRRSIKNIAAVEERRRLARDLHDSVTQIVYSMTLFTRSSQEALEDGDKARLAANLEHLENASLQALREMRFMLFELQPPALEADGLAGAINARLDMVERRVGISAEANIDPYLASLEIERDLYYVAIEALNNTLKHAGADKIKLKITRDNGCIRLSVTDNGRGIDPSLAPTGMGINNMRKRIENLGGELQIDSSIDGGTFVIATVPVT
jgi:signal transduction histidine kinase